MDFSSGAFFTREGVCSIAFRRNFNEVKPPNKLLLPHVASLHNHAVDQPNRMIGFFGQRIVVRHHDHR